MNEPPRPEQQREFEQFCKRVQEAKDQESLRAALDEMMAYLEARREKRERAPAASQ